MKQVGNLLKTYTHPATDGMKYRWFAGTPTHHNVGWGSSVGAGFYFESYEYRKLFIRQTCYQKSGMVKGFVEAGDV